MNESTFDHLNPSYAAGQVFSHGMLSRVSAQTFYNPYLIVIIFLMSSNLKLNVHDSPVLGVAADVAGACGAGAGAGGK